MSPSEAAPSELPPSPAFHPPSATRAPSRPASGFASWAASRSASRAASPRRLESRPTSSKPPSPGTSPPRDAETQSPPVVHSTWDALDSRRALFLGAPLWNEQPAHQAWLTEPDAAGPGHLPPRYVSLHHRWFLRRSAGPVGPTWFLSTTHEHGVLFFGNCTFFPKNALDKGLGGKSRKKPAFALSRPQSPLQPGGELLFLIPHFRLTPLLPNSAKSSLLYSG